MFFLKKIFQKKLNVDEIEDLLFENGVEPKFAEKIISISQSFNIEAKIIGRVEKSKSKKLSIKSEFGEFNY